MEERLQPINSQINLEQLLSSSDAWRQKNLSVNGDKMRNNQLKWSSLFSLGEKQNRLRLEDDRIWKISSLLPLLFVLIAQLHTVGHSSSLHASMLVVF